MNKERIEQLIAHLKTLKPREFNMEIWGKRTSDECGTVACIAGYAVSLFQPRTFEWLIFSDKTHTMDHHAAIILGAQSNGEQHRLYQLFLGDGYNGDVEDITIDQAITALEHLLEHGWADFSEEVIG